MAFLSRAVFDYRRDLMTALMDHHRLDALAFTSIDFGLFAANFAIDVETWERPVVVVIPRSGSPWMVLNELSTNHFRLCRARGQAWIDDVTFYHEHPAQQDRAWLTPQWPQAVADLLDAKGLRRARIGVEGTGGPFGQAAAHLPDVTLVPVTPGMRDLRLVKHEEELAVMRACGALTDWGMERLRAAIRPGRLAREMDFAVAAEIAEEAAKRHSDEDLQIRVWTVPNAGACSPHGTGAGTAERLTAGEVMISNVILRLNGLTVENERTLFCGAPSEDHRTAYEVARAANEAANACYLTGRAVSAPDAAAQAVIEAAGYGGCIFHRTGHGMGTKGHEFPDDMAFNHRPMLEKEVYSCEPGVYVYGQGGYRIDDSVVVRHSAPELLTNTPRSLEWAIVD